MPELPEVTTTVDGLNKEVAGLRIVDVWTDYFSPLYEGKDHIKNKKYFPYFKKGILGATIIKAERRAKNILIHLNNRKTILIHMKMTGHLLYGQYVRRENSRLKTKNKTFERETWMPHANEDDKLRDPFNRFIHLVFSLSDGKHLVMSDLRKFGKITLAETSNIAVHKDLAHLGPDPLSRTFTFSLFKSQILKKPGGYIKLVLMDQSLISGIGNIYSDEILYETSIHPLSHVSAIPETQLKKMWRVMKKILAKGINFGGDSTSDYRNIYGEHGKFQHHHKVYRETHKPCLKHGCPGIIQRISLNGRGAHFCDTHQIRYELVK